MKHCIHVQNFILKQSGYCLIPFLILLLLSACGSEPNPSEKTGNGIAEESLASAKNLKKLTPAGSFETNENTINLADSDLVMIQELPVLDSGSYCSYRCASNKPIKAAEVQSQSFHLLFGKVAKIKQYAILSRNVRAAETDDYGVFCNTRVGKDGLRWIYYNPRFLSDVFEATNNNEYAICSVFAHELGHQLAGHDPENSSISSRELDADEASGFMIGLAFDNASQEDAAAALLTSWMWDNRCPTPNGYPPLDLRISKIREGFDSARSPSSDEVAGNFPSIELIKDENGILKIAEALRQSANRLAKLENSNNREQ